MKLVRKMMLFTFVYTLVLASPLKHRSSKTRYDSCNIMVSDILKQAYRHYPSIKASKKLLLSTQAQIEAAKWNYYPTPSIDISQGKAGRRRQIYRIEQPLWTGGKLDAQSNKAKAQGKEALYSVQESGYVLIRQVLGLVRMMLQSQGEIEAYKRGKADLNELANMLRRRIQAGVSSKADEALIQARIAQIDAELTTATQRYAMAKQQLELITGNPMRCRVDTEHDPYARRTYRYKSVQKRMLQTHPVIQKMDAQIAIAKSEKEEATAAVMPTVAVRVEHQRGSLFVNDPVNNETIAYVALNVSPGAGLSSLSNIQSARYKVMQAYDNKHTKIQELQNQLMQDFTMYTSASMRLDSVQRSIETSQKVLESYKRLFLAGKRRWLDLVNTSREVTTNRVKLAQLKADYIVSHYLLALQSGDFLAWLKEK